MDAAESPIGTSGQPVFPGLHPRQPHHVLPPRPHRRVPRPVCGGHHRTSALVCYVVAASTDFLDGQIARRTQTVSWLGKIMDPVMDRVLLFTGVLGLLIVGDLPMWVPAFVIGRDLGLGAGGLILQHFLRRSAHRRRLRRQGGDRPAHGRLLRPPALVCPWSTGSASSTSRGCQGSTPSRPRSASSSTPASSARSSPSSTPARGSRSYARAEVRGHVMTGSPGLGALYQEHSSLLGADFEEGAAGTPRVACYAGSPQTAPALFSPT